MAQATNGWMGSLGCTLALMHACIWIFTSLAWCLYRVRIDIMVSMNKEIWRELLGGAITGKTAAD